MSLTGLKPRCQQGWFLWGLWEGICSAAFLRLQSQQTGLELSPVASLWAPSRPPFSTWKDPGDYMGSTWTARGSKVSWLVILNSTWVPHCSLPCKLIYSQVAKIMLVIFGRTSFCLPLSIPPLKKLFSFMSFRSNLSRSHCTVILLLHTSPNQKKKKKPS